LVHHLKAAEEQLRQNAIAKKEAAHKFKLFNLEQQVMAHTGLQVLIVNGIVTLQTLLHMQELKKRMKQQEAEELDRLLKVAEEKQRFENEKKDKEALIFK